MQTLNIIVRHLLEGKCFRGKPGRLPSRPLADVDARRLNKQYHFVAVEEKRRDCVVCAKVVSVCVTVCVTCDCKPLCLLSHRNCWEKWHTLVEYWRYVLGQLMAVLSSLNCLFSRLNNIFCTPACHHLNCVWMVLFPTVDGGLYHLL